MKRFHLIISFLIGLILSIMGFLTIFCSSVASEPVTLSILLNTPEWVQWQPMVEKFEATHPHIRLNLVEGPSATNQIEDLYTSSFLLGDSPYDLVYMDIVWVPKLAAAGWLRDLSNDVNESQLSGFLPKSLEGGIYKDKLYWIPFRSDAGMLYYRQDFLRQAGYNPPKTFQELFKISKEIQDQGLAQWGYVCQGGWGLGISATTAHPQEAYEVIQYITSKENQRDFVLRTGKVPSLGSLFTDPKIVAKYPHYSELLPIVQKATLRPPIAQYAQVSDILQRYLSAALTNTMTPQAAMSAAAQETRLLLSK